MTGVSIRCVQSMNVSGYSELNELSKVKLFLLFKSIYFVLPWTVPLTPPFFNRSLTSRISRLSYHKHLNLPLYSVPKHSTEVYIFHLQLRICVWSVASANHLCTCLWRVGLVSRSSFTGEEMSCVNSHLNSPLPYPLFYPCKDTICVKSTRFIPLLVLLTC